MSITNEEREWFKFSIGDNQAIVNIDNVFNITSVENVNINKMIDNTSDYISGVVDILGVPIPVIDLKRYVNISDEEYASPKQMILILKIVDKINNQQKLLGLQTDEIVDSVKLNESITTFSQDTTLLFHKAFHDIINIKGEFLYKLDVEILFEDIPRQWEDI